MIRPGDVVNHSDVKVVVLGPAAVGKTSITMRYIQGKFEEMYDPSLKDSYYKKYNIDGNIGVLELMDTGGQEDYMAITDDWIRQGQAFLVVYSIDSEYTFQDMERIIKLIKQIREGEKIPIMMVGNKSDLEEFRQVSVQEAQDLARSLGVRAIETSAKANKNIKECIEQLVSMTLRRMQKHQKPNQDDVEPKGCPCCLIV